MKETKELGWIDDEDQTSEVLPLNVCDSLDSSLIMKSSDLSGFLEMETDVCFSSGILSLVKPFNY